MPLALPEAPVASEVDQVPTVTQIGEVSVKLDDLGPMVVNSDGTLSRIANWSEMTEEEKKRTLRVLVARNKVRLANEERKQTQQQQCQSGEGTTVDQSEEVSPPLSQK